MLQAAKSETSSLIEGADGTQEVAETEAFEAESCTICLCEYEDEEYVR